ncbi:MAG: hypothetical protein K2X11_00810, partial [Acetobacteraceae bacterium]|nr:hypothetical protein [Acetobacteraceae bacterium]
MSLGELLRALWARRWRIALAVALLYAGSATLVWTWPRGFVASAVVAPAETTGIATSALLAPVPVLQPALLDSRPGGNFAVYLAALRSPEAAAMLARDTPILAQLTERRGAGALGWLREALGLRVAADADDVLAFLERNLGATASLASVTWTLELVHRDRASAQDMLARLHALAEARVRASLAELAARRIFALEARLRAEPDLFLRATLHELLAQQQRAALVVAADEAVAARLVSAPVVELRPSVPNRPLLLALLAVAVPGAVLLLFAAAALLRGPDIPAPPRGTPAWPMPPRREGALVRTPTA